MDRELLDYGVSFGDWRYPNVVYAPKSPPGLPSMHRGHERIISTSNSYQIVR